MEPKVEPPPLSTRAWIGYAIGLPLAACLLLFVPAGTLDWPRAWALLIVLFATSLVACVVLATVNPIIFRARSRIQPGTESWDRPILAVLSVLSFSILPVAGLDRRFGGTMLPWWMVALGLLGVFVGIALMTWAQAVNAFFEPGVRLQTERGQHVVDTGPYAYLRHPGYVAAMKLVFGMALALGSAWALVPAVLSSAVFVLRTAWEDRLLRASLPGYADYAARVRWRLVWGVW